MRQAALGTPSIESRQSLPSSNVIPAYAGIHFRLQHKPLDPARSGWSHRRRPGAGRGPSCADTWRSLQLGSGSRCARPGWLTRLQSQPVLRRAALGQMPRPPHIVRSWWSATRRALPW